MWPLGISEDVKCGRRPSSFQEVKKLTVDFRDQITIGIPAYNEEQFIGDTIASAVGQSRHILVADNASTDDTAHICAEFAARYGNVRYMRHSVNGGAHMNFTFLLDKAETEYFMWLGAHDRLSDAYATTLVRALKTQPDAVLAFAPARHVDRHSQHRFTYDYFLYSALVNSNDVFERLYGLIRFNDECSLVHGVFRTKELKAACVNIPPCIGGDMVLLFRIAALGRFVYSHGAEYIRRELRDDDTMATSLDRIKPGDTLHDNCYDEMLREQAAVVSRIQQVQRMKKRLWQQRIRYQMIRRYGFFRSGNLWGDSINASIDIGYRAARKLAKLFGIKPLDPLMKARRYPSH
jgi:glycosyltransferase involved in cell wall biosynthesis